MKRTGVFTASRREAHDAEHADIRTEHASNVETLTEVALRLNQSVGVR